MTKRKYLAVVYAAALCTFCGAAGAAAEETDVTEAAETVAQDADASEAEEVTEAAQETETEKAEDFTIDAGDVTLKVDNESGRTITAVNFVPGAAEASTETADSAEADADTAEEAAAGTGTLTLTEEDGTAHVFEEFDPSAAADPSLTADDGFLFIDYTNADGEDAAFYETADEITFDAPAVKFVTNEAYIRSEADADSEAVAVASLGSELQALGATPKWVKVTQDDVTGYISRSCVTSSRSEADSAVSADNAEAERKAAEAAAAAAAAQQQAAASSGSSSSSGVYEVSRENIDDCDGSGHGVTIITYSDGSTREVNY